MKRTGYVILALLVLAAIPCAVFAQGGNNTPEPAAIPGGPSPARTGEQTGESVQNGPCGPACRNNWPTEPVEPVDSEVSAETETEMHKVFIPIVHGAMDDPGCGY